MLTLLEKIGKMISNSFFNQIWISCHLSTCPVAQEILPRCLLPKLNAQPDIYNNRKVSISHLFVSNECVWLVWLLNKVNEAGHVVVAGGKRQWCHVVFGLCFALSPRLNQQPDHVQMTGFGGVVQGCPPILYINVKFTFCEVCRWTFFYFVNLCFLNFVNLQFQIFFSFSFLNLCTFFLFFVNLDIRKKIPLSWNSYNWIRFSCITWSW